LRRGRIPLYNQMGFRIIETYKFSAGLKAGLQRNDTEPTLSLPLRRIPQGVRVRHSANLFQPERPFFASELTATLLSRPTSRGAGEIQVRRTGAWDGGALPAMRRSAETPANIADSEQIKVKTLRRVNGLFKSRKHLAIFYVPSLKRGAFTEATLV
jgi:hypothetical protein